MFFAKKRSEIFGKTHRKTSAQERLFSLQPWNFLKKETPIKFIRAAFSMFPSTLVILNIFETNTVNSCEQLFVEFLDSPSAVTKFIYLSSCLKCCWKSEEVAQPSSVKMRFCKTSKILQKASKTESLFRKTVSSQACNCTKKDTITGVFLWNIYVNIFFHFHFFFGNDKSSHRRFLWKKVILKILQINRKHLGWSSF